MSWSKHGVKGVATGTNKVCGVLYLGHQGNLKTVVYFFFFICEVRVVSGGGVGVDLRS